MLPYCVDISAFDGVSFWAKAATAGAKINLTFVVPAQNPTSNSGDCTSNCLSFPFKTVTLGTAFAEYAVDFSAAAGGSVSVGKLLQELAFTSFDSDWDFSIDQIAFYKAAAGSP